MDVIKFKQFITEVFDKPLDYEWFRKSNLIWGGSFYINDEYIVVSISERGKPDFWNIDFIGEVSGYKITGKGNSFQIFATIFKMIQEFLKTKKPKGIYFSAKESSRIKLYKMFIKKYSSKIGYKQTDEYDGELGMSFVLERK